MWRGLCRWRSFLLATVGAGFLVWIWAPRSGRLVAACAVGPGVGGDALRERIRRETESRMGMIACVVLTFAVFRLHLLAGA